MIQKIITTADVHMRNDDPYGVYDADGVNDFLLTRYDCLKKIIDVAKNKKAHFILAGDLVDEKIIDPQTLYYTSKIIKELQSLRFSILLTGNHEWDTKRGVYASIAHWKHLISDNIRIVTYPKIEKFEGVNYHCIPALADVEKNFPSILKEFYKSIKKSEINILIIHGPIVGARFESGQISATGIQLEYIKKASKRYDYIVCGDLHKHQFLEDNVWYCGAPLQSSLKDKGQERGYQIIDLEKNRVDFFELNSPKFLELNWEPGKKISKIIKSPEKHKEILNNSIVVVKLMGVSKILDSINVDTVKSKLKENGAIRVFIDRKVSEEKKKRIAINSDLNLQEMLQSYIEHKKEELPSSKDEVINKGLIFLR